jgi:Flp pilus assembly pilin Flp
LSFRRHVRVGIKVALSVVESVRGVWNRQKKEKDGMSLIKRLMQEEAGQGLVEYTFVVLLVALVFWLGVKDTAVGDQLAKSWAKVLDCILAPFACSA